MSNKNLLTTFSKVIQTELNYYYPQLLYPGTTNTYLYSTYCFLGKVDAWSNNLPTVPTQDERSIKQTFKNMFVLKRLTSNNITPVIQRFNWSTGTVYDYYRDDIDMFQTDSTGKLLKVFYILNKYDQVFKCLWNGNGSPSTYEPYFQPGSYNTNNIYIGSDGYKWKYMFTVDQGLKANFMDDAWIPLAVGELATGLHNTDIGAGDIEVINVTGGGTGYAQNSVITITITGDGYGANATATVNTTSGMISDILVKNTGYNYTYANVSISSTQGYGATAVAFPSPINGHGSDPTSELGAKNVMFICEFNGSENGIIPTDIEYYQVGLLVNPSDQISAPDPASGELYSNMTTVTVSPPAGGGIIYSASEIVYQGDVNSPSFSGRVVKFDTVTNTLYLINTYGTPTQNSPIFGQSSGTTRTLLIYSIPNVIPFSGYIAYIENREGIQRSSDGIEQFKFVLEY